MSVLPPGVESPANEVNMFWYGRLSGYERVSIASFTQRGVHVTLWTYAPEAVMPPDGATVRDAADILPRDHVTAFITASGEVVGRLGLLASYFRYALLDVQGGWYVDADVLLVGHTLPNAPVFAAWERPNRVANNAVLRFPARHPVVRECFRVVQRMSARELARAPWGQIGPQLLTKAIQGHGDARLVAPKDAAYAIPWSDALDLIDPLQFDRCDARVQGASFLHLWNDVLRRYGVNKAVLPPVDSFLRREIDRFGLQQFFSGEYTAPALPLMREVFELRHRLQARPMRTVAAVLARYDRFMQSRK